MSAYDDESYVRSELMPGIGFIRCWMHIVEAALCFNCQCQADYVGRLRHLHAHGARGPDLSRGLGAMGGAQLLKHKGPGRQSLGERIPTVYHEEVVCNPKIPLLVYIGTPGSKRGARAEGVGGHRGVLHELSGQKKSALRVRGDGGES
jgi:hypothetical protein